ncbi:MAG: 5-formyltetrahydrofolate cyclo-ligase [Bacteroidota bacterium]
MKNKKELRKVFKEKRAALPEDEWSRASRSIQNHTKAFILEKDIHRVHCFVSINSRKEPDTHGLIQWMLSRGMQVFIPVMQSGRMLIHHHLTQFSELEPNEYGILEPPIIRGYQQDFDLIIVPMLAGDRNGYRLGYGKGYYDTFLSKESDTCSLGLLFNDFLVEGLPVEAHDVSLSLYMSEDGPVLFNVC